jgi:hypothetical protein
MDTEKIQNLLNELHSELADADSLPEGLAKNAREVIADLKESLPSDDDSHGVVERLEEVAAGFESEHPSLASAARQIASALGRMGI